MDSAALMALSKNLLNSGINPLATDLQLQPNSRSRDPGGSSRGAESMPAYPAHPAWTRGWGLRG